MEKSHLHVKNAVFIGLKLNKCKLDKENLFKFYSF